MFKNISIVTALSIISISLTACGGDDEKEIQKIEAQKNTQVVVQEPIKIVPENPYLDANWEDFKRDVKNESLISVINESVTDYKNSVTKVISDGEAIIKEIKEEIQSSIDEGKIVISEQQKLFKEQCDNITDKNQAKQCSSIEENIFNIEQKIKELDVEIKNRVGELEVQIKNQLNSLKNSLMNNINKNRSSLGLDKADPFKKE